MFKDSAQWYAMVDAKRISNFEKQTVNSKWSMSSKVIFWIKEIWTPKYRASCTSGICMKPVSLGILSIMPCGPLMESDVDVCEHVCLRLSRELETSKGSLASRERMTTPQAFSARSNALAPGVKFVSIDNEALLRPRDAQPGLQVVHE